MLSIEKKVMIMRKKTHYVNNEDFLNSLIEYRKQCKKAKSEKKSEPPIPNYIGECFIKIAERLSTKPNFMSYSFREEMISDGIENCLMYFRNFDPKQSKNPFAYFTQIIYFSFLRRIAKEKKQLYLKYKATEQFGIFEMEEMYEDDNGNLKSYQLYDNISEFIRDFEEKKRAKKKKKLKGIENFIETDVKELDDI